jgi:hypothetical protein
LLKSALKGPCPGFGGDAVLLLYLLRVNEIALLMVGLAGTAGSERETDLEPFSAPCHPATALVTSTAAVLLIR